MQPLPSQNRFNDFMSRIGDYAILNMVWVVCSLPIVTLGASTSALFEMTRQIQEGRDTHLIRRFTGQLRHNFAKNLVLTLIYTAFFCLSFFDLHYLSSTMGNTTFGAISYACVATVAILILLASSFIFPLSGRSRLSVGSQIRQSASVSLRHPCIAIIITALNATPIVISLVIPGGVAFVIFFWGLLFSAISAWIIVALMVRYSIIAQRQ
ncbi:DUF624 domain-containing protein [Bifidobacterium aquikefiri]|uniref:DUF624 domain-containing protein n=2 Tax=Bifidobacterium aquikefiri TaxID=1653207 RepID=UPI0039E831FA